MVDADPRAVLEAADSVAVVGCSTSPMKAAHRIPLMLQQMGYDVHPVHPTATEILGVPAVPTLADLDIVPDLVVVFRPSAEAAGVTRQAIRVGAAAVWLQLGITSTEAAQLAAEAGIDYVEDRCSGVDARSFGIDKRSVA